MIRLFRFALALGIALLPAWSAWAQSSSETETFRLAPVEAGMSTSHIMHSRPFVLPDHLTPAFDFDSISSEPVTEDAARAQLERFLVLRNLPRGRIENILIQFSEPANIQVIPAPNLRAALLMLSDWTPYQVTIDAILDGANESGLPFEAVDFRPLEFGAAVATLQIAFSTGHLRLLVSDRYRHESPQQLIPVLVHESLHDGVDNSFEEETIASLLDSLTYAEVLTIDPDAANTGTELAAYNNVQLFALMNSIGRRGAGYVGVETSFDGDVYIGPGLENFDADSIRAGIASDPWYSRLPRGGSQGGAVLRSLLGRFPESATLVTPDRFSEDAVAAIDEGIGLILTPRKVRALAVDLQLMLTTGPATGYQPGELAPSAGQLSARPFLPSDPALFDLRAMHPAPEPFDTEFSRAALRESLVRAGLSASSTNEAIAVFDDAALASRVPAPSLRAGLLILRRNERWSSILDSAIDGANDTGGPVRIDYRELPNTVPALWDSHGWDGAPVVWINDMLNGERPELLATAIAEGLLLESTNKCAAQAVIAAALSTVLWADLLTYDPDLASAGTWGTISRNRDLLALMNTQPFDPGNPTAAAVGLRLSTGSDGDVLPGLLRDAGSFRDYVVASPRVPNPNPAKSAKAPPVLTELLRRTGIQQATPTQSIQIDDTLLARVDLRFATIFPESGAIEAASALELTLSSS